MTIEISLPQANSKQEVIILKNYLDTASIEGNEKNEINRSLSNSDQMGAGDIINSITTIIAAAQRPLTELVKCLQKFVDNYRTEITIPTKNGDKITISHGRSMKAEQIKEIVTSIQKNIL